MTEEDRNNAEIFSEEEQFLGMLLLEREWFRELEQENLLPAVKDFLGRKQGLIFKTILKTAESRDEFTLLTIIDELRAAGELENAGGSCYLLELISSEHLRYPVSDIVLKELAQNIRSSAELRRLRAVLEEAVALTWSPGRLTGAELRGKVLEDVSRLDREEAVHELQPEPDGALQLLERISNGELGEVKGIPTGFAALDAKTNGLRPGALTIIAARPGMGKTSLAMNIVTNIVSRPDETRPALVFSLEMPVRELELRMLSSFGGVSVQRVKEDRLTQAQYDNMLEGVCSIAKREGDKNRPNLFIDDATSTTPSRIAMTARRYARQYGGLSVIMVDYIQLMRVGHKVENRNLEVGEISRSLKLLAKDLGVPVVALSQLNREVEGRRGHRPSSADLRDSGSLEQDADLILLLNRESVYSGKKNFDADLIISKNRHGETGDIKLTFEGEYTTFKETSAQGTGRSGTRRIEIV